MSGINGFEDKSVTVEKINRAQVEGQIFLDIGFPAQGITVRAYNRGFGGKDTLIGESKTDEKGLYNLSYQLSDKAANLEIRVVDDQGAEIACSNTKFKAKPQEVLNLVAPAANFQPLATEYQRLATDLNRQLDSLDELTKAQENGDRQDLTLLHQTTGWDARLIALTAEAVKLSLDTRIPREALYAMFRVGLPTDKEQLAQISGQILEQAIAKAQESGIVTLTKEQISGAREAFESFARPIRRLAIVVSGTVSSIGDLLNKSGLTESENKINSNKTIKPSEKEIFEDLHFTYEGTELWKQAIKSGIPKDKVNNLQLQGKLAYLTLNNAELVDELQKEIKLDALQKEIKLLDNLDYLAEKGFYKTESWMTRLTTLARNDEQQLKNIIPPIYEGENISDCLVAYAADLARKVRLSFPTQVVRRMIEANELKLRNQHNELKTPVSTFLKEAEGLGFELGRTPIAAFIHQNQTVLDNIEPSQLQSTIESIKLLQRLYQITPTDESLKILMDQKFTSAQDVVAFPYETFLDYFGSLFPSLDEARLVYRKAEQVNTVTFNFFSAAKQIDSAPATHVTSPPASVREAAKNQLIRHYPTMETLFGSLDFCECEHCRSVLSPAAYFADLLQFIDPKQLVWQRFLTDWQTKHGTASYPFKNPTEQTNFLNKWRIKHPGQPDPSTEKTPYEVLIERRPDLPNLPLTCENTHTALPYIDVVNEILEYYVANDRLAADSGHDTGSATTPELLAEPQNILAAAYAKLKDEKYPLNLPFDLWLRTVRRFYEHFEIGHASILEMLRPTDELFPPETNKKPYYRNVIWSESLSISPSEYDIFTNFDPIKWYELYGYTNEAEAITKAQDENGQRIDLNSAKTLSRRLGVSYKELVELLQTGFVNPQLEKLGVLRKLGVNVDDIFRYKSQAGYPAFTPEERVDFKARLQALTAKFSGFHAETWLDTAWNNGEFNQILLLADPNAGCNFDLTILRYANNTSADSLVFFKLNLFVRLWRKLGWTITEIDQALQVFIPHTMLPLTVTNIGSALKTALVYLAHLKEISDHIKVGKDSRLKLLTLWSNLSTTGSHPLYAQLFLKQSVLKNDPIFDHPLGKYLQYFDANTNQYLPFQWDTNQPEEPTTGNVPLKSHLLALQGALGLTSEEITLILNITNKNSSETPGLSLDSAALNLENISLLYRYGLLAKALKLPINDLIVLRELSGLDPFKSLKADGLTELDDDYPFTQTIKFIETTEKIKQSGFKIEDLDYLLRHRFDPVGKSFRSCRQIPH